MEGNQASWWLIFEPSVWPGNVVFACWGMLKWTKFHAKSLNWLTWQHMLHKRHPQVLLQCSSCRWQGDSTKMLYGIS
eukprot:5583049-Amphidinium_carterae.2